jgi:hypothetical protein
VRAEEIFVCVWDTFSETQMLNTTKETFQLLADAASRIQLRQRARTASRWYFTLAFLFLIAALFHLHTPMGIGWLACGIGLTIVALYGLTGTELESILTSRIGVAIAVAIFSLYSASRAQQGFGFLFTVLGGALALSSAIGLRAYWRIQRTPPDLLERVQNAFVVATDSDPDKTPGLVSFRRASGWKTFLPNDNAQYDYRLLYDRDVVFLIGINSFLGIRYSPLFRFVVPSRTFHIEVLGDSRTGKRNKVRLMLDNEPLLEPLEVTPEMLLKARQQMAESPL